MSSPLQSLQHDIIQSFALSVPTEIAIKLIKIGNNKLKTIKSILEVHIAIVKSLSISLSKFYSLLQNEEWIFNLTLVTRFILVVWHFVTYWLFLMHLNNISIMTFVHTWLGSGKLLNKEGGQFWIWKKFLVIFWTPHSGSG